MALCNSAVNDMSSQKRRTVARIKGFSITYDCVYSALCKLNVFYTRGDDTVHPLVLKSLAGLLAYLITSVFERSLR